MEGSILLIIIIFQLRGFGRHFVLRFVKILLLSRIN